MDAMRTDPNWVGVSIRLYRLLLLVYPSAFRREYGAPMLQVFGDRARAQLQQSGLKGLLAWWGWTMLDTVLTAIEEHTQRGVDMSREKFEKLSGWALLLGGPTFFLGMAAGQRPEYNSYNYYSLWIDRYANVLEGPLIILGILLFVVGYGGLLRRFGGTTSAFGRFGLGLGIASGLVAVAGVVGMWVSETGPWWYLFIWGLVLQFSGMAIFGLACLRERVLPRWNGLPLLAGIWMPVFMLYASIYEAINGRWVDWPFEIFVSLWSIIMISMAGIGLLLLNTAHTEEPVPAAT